VDTSTVTEQGTRQGRLLDQRDRLASRLHMLDDMAANSHGDPHGIMPVQFGGGRPPSAERRLMLAVLADALEIHRKYAHVPAGWRRILADETAQWFSSDHHAEWPFSFVNLCAALGIDAEEVRAQLTSPGSASMPATSERPAVGVPIPVPRMAGADRSQR
jgi:hypothetical protein